MTLLNAPLTVAATVTSAQTLPAGRHVPVDAGAGAVALTLPTPAHIGARLRVEKIDATANAVSITGTIRGATSTVTLTGQYELLEFSAESLTSWRPSAGHRTKANLDANYARIADVGAAGTVTGDALRAAFGPRHAVRLPDLRAGSIPGVLATPATITEAAGVASATSGTTGSTLTAPINYPYDTTGKWRFLGFVPLQDGTRSYWLNGVLGSGPGNAGFNPAARIEFVHDGQAFEFALRAVQNGQYRVMADGQWTTAAASAQLNPDGTRRLVKVDFGSRAIRKVTIELERLSFGGINIAGTDSIWQSAAPAARLLGIGDSYTYGQGAGRFGSGFLYTVAALLGTNEVWNAGLSGSGYLNPSAVTGGQKFEARIDAVLAAMGGSAPDIIVVTGSLNDSLANNATYTTAAVQAAASSLYAHLATACPLAAVFVVPWQMTTGSPVQEAIDKQAAIKAAALAAPNVSAVIDNYSAADPWITGTGKSGATTGVGNADVLIGTDGVHPTQEGHDVYGQRIGRAIRDYYHGLIRGLG